MKQVLLLPWIKQEGPAACCLPCGLASPERLSTLTTAGCTACCAPAAACSSQITAKQVSLALLGACWTSHRSDAEAPPSAKPLLRLPAATPPTPPARLPAHPPSRRSHTPPCPAEAKPSEGFAAYIQQRGYDLHTLEASGGLAGGAGAAAPHRRACCRSLSAGLMCCNAAASSLPVPPTPRLARRLPCPPLMHGPLMRGPLMPGPLMRGPPMPGPLMRGPLMPGPLMHNPPLYPSYLQAYADMLRDAGFDGVAALDRTEQVRAAGQ